MLYRDTPMDYRLVILTHGDSATLEETLWSFLRNVKPLPSEAVLVYDGKDFDFTRAGDAPYAITDQWTLVETGGPRGFGGATARAWAYAAVDPGPEFVFWLEHDFTFNWPVHLDPIARILNEFPSLAQMALLRQPVSADEIKHGGYLNIPSRLDMYVPQETLLRFKIDDDYVNESVDWFQHNAYWTTNPSLFKRQICVDHKWRPDIPNSEGHFGIELLRERPDTTFGVWIEHTGIRDGKGY